VNKNNQEHPKIFYVSVVEYGGKPGFDLEAFGMTGPRESIACEAIAPPGRSSDGRRIEAVTIVLVMNTKHAELPACIESPRHYVVQWTGVGDQLTVYHASLSSALNGGEEILAVWFEPGDQLMIIGVEKYPTALPGNTALEGMNSE
jgi:hypothetical protein